jgi:hypothetical protein
LISVVAPFLGGLYGMIHHRITYSISSEYYTESKFDKFYISEDPVVEATPSDDFLRQEAMSVGFLEGFGISFFPILILGLFGFFQANAQKMLFVVSKSLLIMLFVTFLIGLLGGLYGKYFMDYQHVLFPINLQNKSNYVVVQSIFRFSFWGVFIGLMSGFIYQVRH